MDTKKYVFALRLAIALFVIVVCVWGWLNAGMVGVIHYGVAFTVGWFVHKWVLCIREVTKNEP